MKAYFRLGRIEKLASSAGSALRQVGRGAIVAMLLITCVDVIGYKLFHHSIIGSAEIIGLLGLVTVTFSLLYTQVLHGHIEIDFMVTRLPKRAQAVIASIVSLFGFVLFILITWQMYDYGRIAQAAGRTSGIMGIPLSPLSYAMAACCLLVCVPLLVVLLRSIKGVVGK
jgi:TRAP-type C4-dicarboxylate transport system permease small subunit